MCLNGMKAERFADKLLLFFIFVVFSSARAFQNAHDVNKSDKDGTCLCVYVCVRERERECEQ